MACSALICDTKPSRYVTKRPARRHAGTAAYTFAPRGPCTQQIGSCSSDKSSIPFRVHLIHSYSAVLLTHGDRAGASVSRPSARSILRDSRYHTSRRLSRKMKRPTATMSDERRVMRHAWRPSTRCPNPPLRPKDARDKRPRPDLRASLPGPCIDVRSWNIGTGVR